MKKSSFSSSTGFDAAFVFDGLPSDFDDLDDLDDLDLGSCLGLSFDSEEAGGADCGVDFFVSDFECVE